MGGFPSFFHHFFICFLDHKFREENWNQYDFYELNYKEFHFEIGDNFHYAFLKHKILLSHVGICTRKSNNIDFYWSEG